MFSTTIKQSVATLGVVAGLLAAAGPASAQILDGPVLAKPEAGGAAAGGFVKAPAKTWTEGNNQPSDYDGYRQGAGFRGELVGLEPTVKAPADATSAGISGKEMTDAVKAPASPPSVVFTSVSNVALLHGDATTIWVW